MSGYLSTFHWALFVLNVFQLNPVIDHEMKRTPKPRIKTTVILKYTIEDITSIVGGRLEKAGDATVEHLLKPTAVN
jgi:hypothetical protein